MSGLMVQIAVAIALCGMAHMVGDYIIQSPRAAGQHLPYQGLGHSVFGGQGTLGHFAGRVLGSDLSGGLWGENRCVVVSAAGHQLRLAAAPVRVAAHHALGVLGGPVPASADHVGGVLRRGSNYQVSRVAAGSVVARVAEKGRRFWYFVAGHRECEPVGAQGAAFASAAPVEDAVTVDGGGAGPWPARGGSSRPIDLRPESRDVVVREGESIHG